MSPPDEPEEQLEVNAPQLRPWQPVPWPALRRPSDEDEEDDRALWDDPPPEYQV